jgi:transcription antitermination factor NusG
MIIGTTLTNTGFDGLAIRNAAADFAPEAMFQPRWYAAYTRANHERRVAYELVERGVENFLPQYESLRKWKDRRVLLARPLFPGYVFVRLALQHKLKVLQVPGVACLVGFGGRPAEIPGEDFARVRQIQKQGIRATPHPFLAVGCLVRVKTGPLQGLEGFVVRRKGGARLIVTLDLIRRSVAVEMEMEDLERA